MRQVDQLRHPTSNAIVDRLGRRVALNDTTRPEQHACLDRLQGDVARVKEACAFFRVLYTSSTWVYACEEVVGGESVHASVGAIP